MTIVALTYFQETFVAISDSRISMKMGAKLEKFSKLFSHRYKFTIGTYNSISKTYTGELGLAFSGSTLFGLAFSNMFSRIISEMHSIEDAEPPTFSAFVKIAKHCATVLCEYILDETQCFEVLVFGFDPRSLDATILHLKLGPGSSGVELSVEQWYAQEDKIKAIGTGSKHLPDNIPDPSKVPLSIFVSKVVSSNVDQATGGDIQVMELSKSGASFFGTMVEGKSWDDAIYYGVKRSDLGNVDGFCVGRSEPINLKPFNAVKDAAHKKTRRLKDMGGEVPKNIGNIGPVMSFLSVLHSQKAKGCLDDNYQLERSSLIPGEHYFSKVCPSCWRNSLSIHSPAGTEGFQGTLEGNGAVVTTCQFCGGPISFTADDFKKQIIYRKIK